MCKDKYTNYNTKWTTVKPQKELKYLHSIVHQNVDDIGEFSPRAIKATNIIPQKNEKKQIKYLDQQINQSCCRNKSL